ncbi:alpha/beta hydrolase [Enterococcus pallens]|uniref:Phospholipase/carboxylesterase n=1 Tax=Enterococcus pallens ATCC BAA-351 TaxID=1158607 RepID=R2QIB4_9ENTE|nr:alpha/beta hydrolase [Enterococcus pallens]EOH94918.1 phospholipase/carboxylesterase [Enterococcus pallens ATCC BAA-351]EOU14763.1 phospholipase/carboxylesterase [Enterococcus pallens ATCC BAA-351]OJG76242.1 phospholipase/carboxylesterase [Enterococcus pallens]
MKTLYDAGQAGGKNLLLLHGTGGDETSLVDIARFLDGSCRILSFRGEIQEEGMNRFFKRNGLNQFDVESLEEETDKLLAAIEKESKEKGVAMEDWVLVGYSNGANIAAHLLLERETPLRKGLFFHPMSLEVHTKTFDLSDKKVWLSYGGDRDPIVSQESFDELVTAFQKRNGNVFVEETSTGHQINMEELQSARNWLEGL